MKKKEIRNKQKRIHKYWDIFFLENKQRVVEKLSHYIRALMHYIVSRAVKNAK